MENPLTYQLLHLQFLAVALELLTLETQLLDGIFLQVNFSDPAMFRFWVYWLLIRWFHESCFQQSLICFSHICCLFWSSQSLLFVRESKYTKNDYIFNFIRRSRKNPSWKPDSWNHLMSRSYILFITCQQPIFYFESMYQLLQDFSKGLQIVGGFL